MEDMDGRFSKGHHFEEMLVQALLIDKDFAEQMLEVLDVDYFKSEYLRQIVILLIDYYNKYNVFPTWKALVMITRDNVTDKLLRSKISNYLCKIKKEPLNGDAEYIKEESLDFCKKRSLAIALDNILNLMYERNYESILNEINQALLKGSERDMGHIFLGDIDFEKRMSEVKRSPVSTGWPEIDAIIQGGPSGGELCVIMASTGTGKTHALVDLGVAAAKAGKNVVHYTLELSEVQIGRRYDARLSGIPPEQLPDHKDEVKKALKSVTGDIVIKSYPCKSITTLTLKSHIYKLRMRGMEPDIILIDYADLMRSRNKYEQKRLEEESVYEELRGLSQELDIPCWTVTQTNRLGLDVEVITLKHVAECFGKAMISDVFITMNRKKESNSNTIGNFFIAKNRVGVDGIKFPILMDTAISKIKVLSPNEIDEDETDQQKMKKKLLELQKNI